MLLLFMSLARRCFPYLFLAFCIGFPMFGIPTTLLLIFLKFGGYINMSRDIFLHSCITLSQKPGGTLLKSNEGGFREIECLWFYIRDMLNKI